MYLWRVGRGREPWERSEAGGVIGTECIILCIILFYLTVLNFILNQFLYHFKFPYFIIFNSLFLLLCFYFTFFYVKHFELPLCMKCAIQINLPCLALPNERHLHHSPVSSPTEEPRKG